MPLHYREKKTNKLCDIPVVCGKKFLQSKHCSFSGRTLTRQKRLRRVKSVKVHASCNVIIEVTLLPSLHDKYNASLWSSSVCSIFTTFSASFIQSCLVIRVSTHIITLAFHHVTHQLQSLTSSCHLLRHPAFKICQVVMIHVAARDLTTYFFVS